MPQHKVRVLFLCTGNSARSLMAEAVLRHLGGERFDVFSAGTEPQGVDARTVEALTAASIPSAGLHSKALGAFVGHAFDFVIALCDEAWQHCPSWPGSGHVLNWGFSDPKTDPDPRAFSRTLSAMAERIRLFIEVNRKVRPLHSTLTADHFYKCLADELRLKILMLIKRHDELCVCDLTDALEASQPKVSRHLALLRNAGMLSDRRQGQWVYYRLHPALPQWMDEVITLTTHANAALIQDCQQRLRQQPCKPD